MDICIKFKDIKMLHTFLDAFKKIGYRSKDYKVIDNTFYFTYKRSLTHKVWTRFFFTDFTTQLLNKKNVNLYNKYLSDAIDKNKLDDSNLGNNEKINND